MTTGAGDDAWRISLSNVNTTTLHSSLFRTYFFFLKLKNVSCEYDRVNGWNSTLHAAWCIRHVRIIWFLWTKRTIWIINTQFYTKYRSRVFYVLSLYLYDPRMRRLSGLYSPGAWSSWHLQVVSLHLIIDLLSAASSTHCFCFLLLNPCERD